MPKLVNMLKKSENSREGRTNHNQFCSLFQNASMLSLPLSPTHTHSPSLHHICADLNLPDNKMLWRWHLLARPAGRLFVHPSVRGVRSSCLALVNPVCSVVVAAAGGVVIGERESETARVSQLS